MIMYPHHIALPNAKRRAVPAVPAQEQAPQIRHVSPQNRKEFRVRATLTSRTLPGGENPDIRGMHGHPSQL